MIYSGPIKNKKTKHDSTDVRGKISFIFSSAYTLVFCFSLMFLHVGAVPCDMDVPGVSRDNDIVAGSTLKKPRMILPAAPTLRNTLPFWGLIQTDKKIQTTIPGDSAVKKDLRNRWIEETFRYLSDPAKTSAFRRMEWKETHQEGNYQKSTRLVQNGILYFEEGTYLKMIAHSAHENPAIGDITLALDSDGRTYINSGHVCGGIIHFISDKKLSNCRIRHFVKHFASDTDDQRWKKISIKESVIRNQPY